MSNTLNVDDFILGDPIETQFGKVRFLSYGEYLKNRTNLILLSMNVLHFYYQFKEQAKFIPVQGRNEFLQDLENKKKLSLFDFIKEDDRLGQIYLDIFRLVLNEESHSNLESVFDNEDLFMGLRQLIMDMNFLTEDPVSDNPEMQEYYEDRKRMKQKESGKQTTSDIITSIVAGSHFDFEVVKNWTVIQVYSIYYRIAAFKNYDSATLFATVSTDVKIDSWSKNIDLFEKEELGINYADFNKKYGGLFD